MKNYVHQGEVVSVLAPYAVASGDGVLLGSLFGVATNAAANTAPVEIRRYGVYDLTAVNTDVATVGAKAYWDNAARRVTTTVASNALIGVFTGAKANGDLTARVVLDASIR